MAVDDRPQFVERVRRIVRDSGFDPEYYVIEDETGNAAYNFYTTDTSDTRNLIYVEDGFAKPSIREISEVSAAVRGLQEGYRVHRICFPAELKDEIAEIYHRN